MYRLLIVALILFGQLGCSSQESGSSPDGAAGSSSMSAKSLCDSSVELKDRAEYDTWLPIVLEGAECGNGEPYTFFVRYSQHSSDLGITMEPGGGCWDYETCSGNAPGRLSALSIEPADDDHMTALPPPLGEKEGAIPWGLLFPHLGDSDAGVPTGDFNQVYLPYCTADAFLGAFSTTYESEDGEQTLELHHQGRHNLELVAEWLSREFPEVGQLFVLGSSAGGLGAMFNYPLLRDAVSPACSALLNDSSPIFVGDGPQKEARANFVDRWQVDSLIETLKGRLGDEEGHLNDDTGELSALLSRAFPDDRFLVAFFQKDLNNSQFSYASSLEAVTADELHQYWAEDTQLLMAELDTLQNWGYFIPYFRPDNCSHTVALLPLNELENTSYVGEALAGEANGYLRTDFERENGTRVDFHDALFRLLSPDDEPPRWLAEPDPSAEFTSEEISYCLE